MSDYIAFPALGWKFSISPYLVHNLQLFGLTINIRWYGVMIAVGFLLAMIYALRSAKRFGINSDRMIDVVLVSTLIAFVGARLYYVVFSDERAKYFANPISILEVWNGRTRHLRRHFVRLYRRYRDVPLAQGEHAGDV